MRGWDYPELCSTYLEAADLVRLNHTPAILHVTELTQPFGHSTSGNHERYKSHERLEWEKEFDCLKKMREWMLERKIATESELNDLEGSENQDVIEARGKAWQAMRAPIEGERREVLRLTEALAARSCQKEKIQGIAEALKTAEAPLRRHVMASITEALLLAKDDPESSTAELRQWKKNQDEVNLRRYSSDLYSESDQSALNVPVVPAVYSADPPLLKGFEVIKACFDAAFGRIPNLLSMGEDVGLLGGVN